MRGKIEVILRTLILGSNWNGLLIMENFDLTALGGTLIELLSNNAERDELGRRYRKHVSAFYTGKAVSRQIAAIYKKVLDRD